jgi:hypothetical protein
VGSQFRYARQRRPRLIALVHSCQPIPGGKRRLTAAYRICILGTWWIIPAGEEWDEASVPRVFRLFIARDELGQASTLGHDKLYVYRGALPYAWLDRSVPGAMWRRYSRDEADQFLQQTALLEGAIPWKANGGAAAVRSWWWTAESLRLSRAW